MNSGIKNLLFELVAKPYSSFFKYANRVNVKLLERCDPTYEHLIDNNKLLLYCPNSLSLWRAKTLLSKEPDTIEWINSFNEDDVLYDIGANVGLYSTYAACKGIQVFAFEPESQNYALLNRNIHLNNLEKKAVAFNIALSSENKIDCLCLNEFLPGASMHNLGENLDYNKNKFTSVFKQGILALTLDRLISEFDVTVPHHIKIDVDGLERSIVDGGAQTLKNPKVKSLLIELNTVLKENLEVIEILGSYGFECVKKYHSPIFDNSPFAKVFNFTFRRR